MKEMKRLIPVFLMLFLVSVPVNADDLQDGIEAGMFYQMELEREKG